MERTKENQRPSTSRLKALQILTILGATTVGPQMIAGVNEHRQMTASAEAQTTITECRDQTRCALGKISLSAERILPKGTHKLNATATGESVTINGDTFEVQQSEHGIALKDTANGTQYFMGKLSLNEALEAVQVLSSQSEK